MDDAAIAQAGLQCRAGLALDHNHIVTVRTQIECRRVANGTSADDHSTHLALPARLPSRPNSDKRIQILGVLNYIASRQLTMIPNYL
jgi:hypothetical protein